MPVIKRIVLLEPMKGHWEKDLIIRDGSCATSGSPVALREPIAIQYIGGYLKSKGFDVIIIQQKEMTETELINKILEYKPDIVGFSVHATYIFSTTLVVASELKRLNPNLYIVYGGNHPTGHPEILENTCIDYVILGEGEEIFYQLVSRISSDADTNDVPGIAWRDKEGKLVINPLAKRLDFNTVAWPLRDKEILESCKCGPLSYPIPPKQFAAAQVSYSRGCSGGCEFCVSNYLWGRQLSYRDPENVIEELKYLKNVYNVNFFFLTDLTFNHNKKKAIDLCKALIKSNLNMSWFAYCNVHLDRELAEYMKEAGCSRIGFGLESVVDCGLEKIKPNQNHDKIAETLKMTSDLGILNRCYLMIGFPWETDEYLQKTKEVLKDLYIDQIRVGFVVPFPGTKIFDDWKEIRSSNFDEYTGDLPVVNNASISKERYIQIRDDIVSEFYNSDGYWNRCKDKIIKHPHLSESYEYFMDYLQRHEIVRSNRLE